MGLMDKIKDLAKITDEEYIDDMDGQYYEEYEGGDYGYEEQQPQEAYNSYDDSYNNKQVAYQPADRERAPGGRVVDITTGRSQVVFKQIDKYEECGSVADVLNEKKIVILNLETCPNDICRRVLDFLYGVAYANHGEIKRVAGRAYIITPNNVPVSGELLDEIGNSGAF